ncbi:MAG TPA: GntR family transcriptional regulator [Dongiaceae bacterium]|nr:GntR family transcriptional regulator [Dongiaceae bacterium]
MFAKRSTIERKTVAESVAETLRTRILAGELSEGEQLRQEVLAADLGVSRIPLREAFRLLEGEGLITIAPHRGAVVAVRSPEEIGELFDLRVLLEPDILRHAVPKLTERDLSEAAVILDGYNKALAERDVQAWGRLNTQFHLALYGPAARPRSLALVRSLLDQTDSYTRMQLLLTGGQQRAEREHTELLKLCRARETNAAAKLVEDHVREAGRSLVDFMHKQAAAKKKS